MIKKFWMVWNPAGRAPTRLHPTKESAEKEAVRLAREDRFQRGGPFYVLEAVERVQLDLPIEYSVMREEPWTEQELSAAHDDQIPF